MGRLIGSVVLGYIVILVFVFCTFSIMWFILGADGSYQPGSWNVSGTWLTFSVILGLVGAVLGGMVCVAVAKTPKGPRVLAIVVVILGLAMAIPVLTQSGNAQEPRPAQVSMLEAIQNARQPTWVALLNPLLGAMGVLIGAGMLARKPRAAA